MGIRTLFSLFRCLLLPFPNLPLPHPPDGAARRILHRTPLEGVQLPALRTPPALSFYVLRVEYLVWAGSPDRYVRKNILSRKNFLVRNRRAGMATNEYL